MRTIPFILAVALAGACARTVARGNGLRIAAVWVRNPPRTDRSCPSVSGPMGRAGSARGHDPTFGCLSEFLVVRRGSAPHTHHRNFPCPSEENLLLSNFRLTAQ